VLAPEEANIDPAGGAALEFPCGVCQLGGHGPSFPAAVLADIGRWYQTWGGFALLHIRSSPQGVRGSGPMATTRPSRMLRDMLLQLDARP
jgi:hypothetical protein